jgi:glycosyltransferase involved in cell wall biosynthesis
MVSVIMPAFNAEKFIRESIDSVIQQNYTDWELIIVDDGSTDSTQEIILEYVHSDSRIKYFFQENGMQGKARNLGISKSRGEFIAFLDSDDLWLEQKLEKQVAVLDEQTVDLVFSDGFRFKSKDPQIKYPFNITPGFYNEIDGLSKFIYGNKIPILSVLVRKTSIVQAGGFCEHPEIQGVEDYHLWLTLLSQGNTFLGMPEKLVKYRLHEGQSTHYDPLCHEQILLVLNQNFTPSENFKKHVKRSKLIWCKSWYLHHANSLREATKILNVMEGILSEPNLLRITRFLLNKLGIRSSKIVLNMWILIKLKIHQINF